MKRNLFIALFLVSMLFEILGIIFLSLNHLYFYVLFVVVLLCITTSILINYYKSTLNADSAYLSYLKKIKRSFSSILINISEMPDLKKKNVIKVADLEEIFDARIELNKPILYLEKEECCIFSIASESDVYLYILTKNNDAKEGEKLFKKYISQKQTRKADSKSKKTKEVKEESTKKKSKSTNKEKNETKVNDSNKSKNTSKKVVDKKSSIEVKERSTKKKIKSTDKEKSKTKVDSSNKAKDSSKKTAIKRKKNKVDE